MTARHLQVHLGQLISFSVRRYKGYSLISSFQMGLGHQASAEHPLLQGALKAHTQLTHSQLFSLRPAY